MDFCNLELWLFVLVALLINIIICKLPISAAKSLTFRKWLICILSLFLLGYVSIASLFIFIYVTLAGYIGCKLLKKLCKKSRNIDFCILVIILISPLVYYKYGQFIVTNILRCESWDALKNVIIPVGISFYTFQIIGYCIDTLKKGEKEPEFLDYINFCSFFPQIVAGPIERKDSLLPQVKSINLTNTPEKVYRGITYIIVGLFFKSCMADNVELISSSTIECKSVWIIWMKNLMFALRIYFDFAGYGIAAYGLAQCLGVRLQMNFWSPYTATNITEFWRRWHISLTGWFRDYIYFPLGGSRTSFWALNIITVFLISGLWHGAGWNFIVWGGLAGVGMVAHRVYLKAGGHMPGFLGWMFSMLWALFSWMFFYETDWDILMNNLIALFRLTSYATENPIKVLSASLADGYIFLLFICLSSIIFAMEYFGIKHKDNPYHYLVTLPSICLMVLLTVIFNPGTSNQFIYFSF